jgi:hypothetical protein
MILMRVSKNQIRTKSAYEFYKEINGNNPVWTSDINQRGAVFTHAGNCFRNGISYNAGIGRYLWWQVIPGGDTRFSGGFGIYDAPEPWGPWTTAYWNESWDVGPGDMGNFATKWMSQDGKTCYLVFSGDDYFSVRKATFTVQQTRLINPTNKGVKEGDLGLSIFPNPFCPSTKISVRNKSALVGISLEIFDAAGRLVQRVGPPVDRTGYNWDAKNLAPGLFLVRLNGGDQSQIKRVYLIR